MILIRAVGPTQWLLIALSLGAANQACPTEAADGPGPRGPACISWTALWHEKGSASASVGGKVVPVYEDPAFPHDLLIDDGEFCWLVDTHAHHVRSPGCGIFFRVDGTIRLREPASDLADVYWDDDRRLLGQSWNDVLADCGRAISSLFRRPSFASDKIEFSTCGRQKTVTIRLHAGK